MLTQPFSIPAIIFLVVSIPLALNLIPRNVGIGIRTPKTLASDEAWYSANSYAGKVLFVSSVIYFAIAAMLPCASPCGENFSLWLVHLCAFGLPLLAGMVLIRQYVANL